MIEAYNSTTQSITIGLTLKNANGTIYAIDSARYTQDWQLTVAGSQYQLAPASRSDLHETLTIRGTREEIAAALQTVTVICVLRIHSRTYSVAPALCPDYPHPEESAHDAKGKITTIHDRLNRISKA